MILIGGFLVVGTWLVLALLVVLVGLPFVVRRDRQLDAAQIATAAWWGLALLVIIALGLSFVTPLHSISAGITLLTTIVAVGGLGLIRAIQVGIAVPKVSRMMWVGLLGIAAAIAFLAVSAIGPVTHYDAGLYQVSAIRYAADFRVIPGLANLYAPLGYGNTQPILGALTGIGPWGENGYRLINGLFLVLLALEATGRLLSRPRSVGAAVALAGTALVFPPMLWMADFWVASPTPDVPALVVAVALTIYWAATLSAPTQSAGSATRPSVPTLPTLVLLSGLLISLRPTMIPFALALLICAVLLEIRRRNGRALLESVPAVVAIAVLVVLSAMRDRVLSGWWNYPLSVASFDVPWRAVDPTGLRNATLGFARNPEDFQSATTGWAWIGPWLRRLPDQWDPWWVLAGLLVGVLLLLLVRIRHKDAHVRSLLFALVPFAVGIVVWFAFSPPAFRFGWGPLFGAAALVLGWAVSRLGWALVLFPLVGIGLVFVVTATVIVKVDFDQPTVAGSWWGLDYAYVPLPEVPVEYLGLESGVEVLVPTKSDQCWDNYPLCSPNPPPGLTTIGDTFDDGLVP